MNSKYLKHMPLDKEYDRIANKVYESFPNSCIIQLLRTDNPDIETKYNTYLQNFPFDDLEILELFHGTSEECIEGIIEEGFKKSKNTVSAYGKGTYMSPKASFSFKYSSLKERKSDTKYLIFSTIIVSRSHVYKGAKYHQDSYGVNVDPLDLIYCINDDDSICPTYVIKFYTGSDK
jgi:hypothetical protein